MSILEFANKARLLVEDRWIDKMKNEYCVNEYEHNKAAQFLLDELIRLSGNELYRFCSRLTYSKEDADDLFQETFLKSLEQMDKLKNAKDPSSYLFTTALYTWKDWKRKYARRNRIAPTEILLDEAVSENSKIEDDIVMKEERQIVQEVVSELPDRYRVPIILYYSVEMNIAEMANILELPQGTVKSRLHKARKLVEKGLGRRGYEI
jgi:RNA polymerase sigma-70 factor (ECF subfamily)